MRRTALAVATAATAVTVAGGAAGASAEPSLCPAAYERLTVASLEAAGPYVVPRLVDESGNNNGYVCALPLPDAARDAHCLAFPGSPACELAELGLPIYQFKDDR